MVEFLTLPEIEKQHILRVLDHTRGRIRPAARILGISRWALARRIRKYRIRLPALEPPWPVDPAVHPGPQMPLHDEGRRGE